MRLVKLILLTLLVGCALMAAGLKRTPVVAAQTKEAGHWAYQPVVRPALPTVRQQNWVRTQIDAFILAKLEAKGIAPSPEADRAALIRRAYLDVWGLLPTPEEVRDFVADRSPDAYEKVVDRLLASPHYGERLGRHWLDLARYADSDGYNQDGTRPNAWRYRDYVIKAFNEDKPYDRFVREQLAGDEISPGDAAAYAATGFLRNYPDEFNARNLVQRRQEILDDLTDTTGSVFLATTVGCARCHNHKFDPIRQEDYYRLQAFFANTAAKDDVPAIGGEALAEYRRRLAAWEEKTRDIRAQMDALLQPLITKRVEERIQGYDPETRVSVEKPAEKRTPYDRWIDHRAQWTLGGVAQRAVRDLKGADKEKFERLQAELKKFDGLHPGELPTAAGITDLGLDAPPTFVLAVGSYNRPTKEVGPGFPPALTADAPAVKPTGRTTGRRSALAEWIANPNNPLTARVIVNRVWDYYFGRGIVASVSDFGRMGARPTHPELLDYLADEFVRQGWSLKRLQRQLLLSATYRQASAFRADAATRDADNALLWRFPRKRLDAEQIRDAALQAAGLLDAQVGGPGVFPPLPVGLDADRAWKVSDNPKDHYRRSVYVFVRRNLPYPLLDAFDMASPNVPCPRREITTTAPQALTLFNSEQVYGWAQALAGRILRESAGGSADRLDRLYAVLYSRAPEAWERQRAGTFLADQRERIAARLRAGQSAATPAGLKRSPAEAERAEAAAFVDLCHALLNSNEFVYRF